MSKKDRGTQRTSDGDASGLRAVRAEGGAEGEPERRDCPGGSPRGTLFVHPPWLSVGTKREGPSLLLITGPGPAGAQHTVGPHNHLQHPHGQPAHSKCRAARGRRPTGGCGAPGQLGVNPREEEGPGWAWTTQVSARETEPRAWCRGALGLQGAGA